jgi:hypothetical protein
MPLTPFLYANDLGEAGEMLAILRLTQPLLLRGFSTRTDAAGARAKAVAIAHARVDSKQPPAVGAVALGQDLLGHPALTIGGFA